jgi:hypothetical protein
MMLLGETIWVRIPRFTGRANNGAAVVSPSPTNGREAALVNACAEILIIRFRATHLNTGHLMKAWSAWAIPAIVEWVSLPVLAAKSKNSGSQLFDL